MAAGGKKETEYLPRRALPTENGLTGAVLFATTCFEISPLPEDAGRQCPELDRVERRHSTKGVNRVILQSVEASRRTGKDPIVV